MDSIAVVIDTNVLYSAIRAGGLSGKKAGKLSPPSIIIAMAAAGELPYYVSDPLMREHERVILGKLDDLNAARTKAGAKMLKPEDISAILDEWVEGAFTVFGSDFDVSPAMEGRAASDERVLELVTACGALLITGNKKHFDPMVKPFGIRVMTPAEFIKVIS